MPSFFLENFKNYLTIRRDFIILQERIKYIKIKEEIYYA